MKKLYFLLFALFIASISFGQVIVSENFNYPDGSLVPNGGWANTSGTAGDFLVQSGKAVVQHGTPSEDVEIAFSSVTGDIYAGFDFSVDDLGAPYVGTDNEYFAHFSFRAEMDIVEPSGSGDYSVGITSDPSVAEATWATDLTFGVTYRAIIKWDQVNGIAQLWIDPVNEASTSISGLPDGPTTVTSFDLRQSDSSENETVRVDDLMIGQTFNDVLVYAPPACGVSFGTATYVCQTNTAGADNDFVEIRIPYTGSDSGITSVTSSDQAASISGDNPATVADGTIVITGQGVQEGYAWDVILNGGDCDSNSTSGTVPSTECDPARSTCFDLSGGAELFELVTVDSNSDPDVWTFSAGTYSMNGYCGGGCTEASDTWLIFGPLDMTGVTDLVLQFDATEGFSGTDLNVQYTSDYSSGCPSGATWTSAQLITSSGNYAVDLSSAMGTDVFVGVQYLDSDGSYSSWSLSNVQLASFSTCPTLGSRPTSACAVCDVSLGTENYVCLTNTVGDNNDGVTVEIPYTGSESTITSITTTSGGTVGGDDPTSVADGTITITGLTEGSAWDLTINGGDCDGTTISGTIPASICDPVSCPNAGDLIISEIMQNPAAASDPAGEYFEIYNNTAAPIDIQGIIIKDDVTTSETHTILGSLVIPANGYVVIGNSATTTPVLDYNYGNDISLGNSTDGLILECSSTVIDQVIWDNGATFPDPSGASMEFSSSFLARINNTDNDNGANWGVATNPLGNGDFGTPGAANSFTLSSESFELSEVTIYPNPTNTGYVNITSKDSDELFATVFDILGKQVLEAKVENNQLNISNLNSGMYILKLSQNNATITKKLVIQ